MRKFPLIGHLHKETQKPPGVPLDREKWPQSWKIVEFKEYERMPQIILPPAEDLPSRFDEVLKKRTSKKINFDVQKTLSLQEISTFLYWSAGIHKERSGSNPEHSFRFYASAGSRYPLEVYLSIRGGAKIETGIYHYNVKKHCLEKICREEGDALIRVTRTYPWVNPWTKDAAVLVFITGIFNRSMRKYKERGYRFVLLEGGALLHNMYLAGTALGLGCSGFGTPVDERVEEILDIHAFNESLLISFAMGPLSH